MRVRSAAVLILMLVFPAWAEAPTSAMRPMPRPVVALPEPVATPPATMQEDGTVRRLAKLRPMARPVMVASATTVAQPDGAVRRLSAMRPMPRPALPEPTSEAIKTALNPGASEPGKDKGPVGRSKKKKAASRKGSVCGDPAIKGEELPRITSKVKGCGVAEPVRVTAVAGVTLNQPATIDCDTARALKTWVDKGLQPAFGRMQVVELKVAAHYICRSRNNIKGAKISEHGRGRAIDIAGIVLESGKTVMVQGGFGKELRKAHKAACGIFGTTLGPGSDGFHEDHMHFDTADYRSGPYCR